MTTIVWDGTYLVSDSQMTQDDIKGTTTKIFKVRTPSGYKLAGFAGAVSTVPPVLEALKQGGDLEPLVGEDSNVMLISPSSIELYGNGQMWTDTAPCVMGSGRMAALAALELGYDAVEAVKVACKIDLYSSGPVRKLKL